MYADDMTLMVKDKKSASEALGVISELSEASGLHLNSSKTQAMWIGSSKDRRDPIGQIEAVDKIKVLGCWFNASNSCSDQNVQPIIKKIENTINIWNQRSLTIKGRITVTRALISSQLVYISSCIEIPKKTLERIQSKIMKFVWRGRPPKVSKEVLVQDIDQGGLKLVDVRTFFDSLKIIWIRRMLTDKNSTWRKILQARIGRIKLCDYIKSLLCKLEIQQLKIPVYYRNMLIQYQRYNYKALENVRNIQKEILWYNRSIRIDGKTVFIYSLYKKGIKYIDDIMRANGTFMNINEIKSRYPGTRINFLTYQSLLKAIPAYWKETLAESSLLKLSDNERNDDPIISLNNKQYGITEVCSKYFYSHEIKNKTPSAVQRWIEVGYQDIEWEKVFTIPYRCTKSTKIQSMQYRIIHRYIPTNRYLFIRKIIDSPQCTRCRRDDTLEHFFYECAGINKIWEVVFTRLEIQAENCARHIIFGMPEERDVINIIILLVKQYIIRCKLSYEHIEPRIEGARMQINNFIMLEKYTFQQNNAIVCFSRKWHGLLDKNDQIKL